MPKIFFLFSSTTPAKKIRIELDEDESLYILKDGYTLLSVLYTAAYLDSLNLDQVMADVSKFPQDYLSNEKMREWEECFEKLRCNMTHNQN